MDRTETLKKLKKELFNLNFQLASNKDKDIEEITNKVVEVEKKINILTNEIENSNGQVAFAFADLIKVN